jgi:hypothetical protein
MGKTLVTKNKNGVTMCEIFIIYVKNNELTLI